MRSVKGITPHQMIVLLLGGIAGGFYGFLQTWPADWVQIASAIIVHGIIWAMVANWAFVSLRPKRTRGTPIGAIFGVVVALILYSVFPNMENSIGRYGNVAIVIDHVVFGALIGALVGTAPRGALIGAGIGAIVVSLFIGVYLAMVSWIRGYEYNWVITFVATIITGLLIGGGLGAFIELGRRSTVTKLHP